MDSVCYAIEWSSRFSGLWCFALSVACAPCIDQWAVIVNHLLVSSDDANLSK